MDAAGEAFPQRRFDDLLRASTTVVEDLELDDVLGRIVEAAMTLVGARYGALGVLGPDGPDRSLSRFIHRGIPPEEAALIGDPPAGHGILGAVIAATGPVRLDELADDSRSVGFPAHHPPMHSFLGVPVRVRGEVYGDLYLTEAHAGAFTEDDERLAEGLAAMAGIAVENARLYEHARTREAWSAALADVMGALLDVAGDDALEVIVERIGPLVRADLVTLAIPDGDDDLRVTATKGRDAAALRGRTHPRSGTPAGRALDSGRAVSIAAQPAGAVFADQGELGPTVALPLRAGHEALGVLTVSRHPGAASFTDAELEMAFVFAGQAGVAIEVVRGREDRRRLELTGDRARIARDLHDHVIQRLFGAGLALQAIAMGTDHDAASALTEQIDALDAAIKEIRTVIFALGAADGPGRGGTRDRLLSVATEIGRPLGRPPRLSFTGAIDSLIARDLADDLVAVVREGLSNAVRHSGAHDISVDVAIEGAEVAVRVRDDGSGIPDHVSRSGLANLAERARLRGGSFDIDTSPAGTVLHWRAPLGGHTQASASEGSTT